MLARLSPLLLVVACAGNGNDGSQPAAAMPNGNETGGGGNPRAEGGAAQSGAASGTSNGGQALGGGGNANASGRGGSEEKAGDGGVSAGGVSAGGANAGGAGAAGSSSQGGATVGSGGQGASSTVTPCVTNQLSQCTGMPLACHFGGAPGNYLVTVQLGAGGQDEIEAEYYRRMLTRSGATSAAWFSFVTNVRVYEGEPLRPDQDDTTSKGIAGLDLYFRGPSPKPLALCFEPMAKPLMLWLEGDSTVTDQESTEYSGWGQHLPQHFVSPVSVANYADSGESSGSVLASAKLWGAVKAGMKAGDWVMLQVGHNDKDTPAATFRSNLLRMVSDTKAAGAHMILVTPISRVGYALAEQHVNSTGANLPQIIRDLGQSESVPVIDLTKTTYDWLQSIDWPDYFANGTDRTHTNPRGADIVSGFVRDGVRSKAPELAQYLR